MNADLSNEVAKYSFLTYVNPTCTDTCSDEAGIQAIQKDIVSIRSFLLLHMFDPTEKGFFNAPSVESLSTCFFKRPERASKFISPILIQEISQRVPQIYFHQAEFSKALKQYFDNDIIDHRIFAFGTFPAVFYYFISPEFTQAAALFLTSFIPLFSSPTVPGAFIVSFFISDRQFFDILWQSFAAEVLLVTKTSDYYSALLKALTKASRVQSHFRSGVFGLFFQLFPEYFATLFSSEIIYDQFLKVESGLSIFASPGLSKQVKNFLFQLTQEDHQKEVTHLIEVMLSQPKLTTELFTLADFSEAMEYPFILSSVDILLLLDVLSLNDFFAIHQKVRQFPIRRSFFPLIFPVTIQNGFLIQKEPTEDFAALFGKVPIQENDKDDSTFSRLYNKLLKISKDGEKSIFDVIKGLQSGNPCKSTEFIEYARTMTLKRCAYSASILYKRISRFHCIRAIQEMGYIDEARFRTSMHRFYEDKIRSSIGGSKASSKNISAAIDEITESLQPPKDIYFSLSCVALNCYNVTILPSGIAFAKKFRGILNQWSTTDMQKEISEPPLSARFERFVKEANVILFFSLEYGLGKALILIHEYVRLIRTFLPEDSLGKWASLFKTGFAVCDSNELFMAFLVLQNVFEVQKLSCYEAGSALSEEWEVFRVGVTSMLKSDANFLIQCCNPHFCSKMFSLTRN